jgi:hypothetical protein
VKEVQQLGAPGHFAGVGQLALFAQGVDGGGFACVGSACKDDLGYAGARTFRHFGGGNLEVGVVEIDGHAPILDAWILFAWL